MKSIHILILGLICMMLVFLLLLPQLLRILQTPMISGAHQGMQRFLWVLV
jgi:hypothetical protein